MDADVTESAGTPGDPDDSAAGEDRTPDASPPGKASEPGAGDTSGAAAAPGGETRSGSGSVPGTAPEEPPEGGGSGLDITVRRKRHWLRWTALGASFVVLVAAGVGR